MPKIDGPSYSWTTAPSATRALPRRRQQPRPRLLHSGGAGDEQGSRRMPCSGSRTCSSSCSRITSRRRGSRLGHAPGHRAPSRRTTSRAPPDAGPLREQFRTSGDRQAFGYRNLEFEAGADDVIATPATQATRPGSRRRRLDRPRRVPAHHGERRADDDAARRLRRQRLHARPRRARYGIRRPGAGLHRAQGAPRTTSRAFRGSATRPPGS
jgi:hypothetical protein